MSHRTVLCRGITPAILVVGLVSFAFLCAPCAGADEKRPSSYSPVGGVMGYKTPNIDRLAKEGMMFTDYYAEQSCTAGRASYGSSFLYANAALCKRPTLPLRLP